MTCRRGGGDLLPGGLAELGYLFLPRARGSGYAVEACGAVLDRFADASPGERVVLRTQVANSPSPRLARKPGFTEVARFEEFGAEQWFGARGPVAPPVRRARAPLPSGPEGDGPLLHNDH